MKITPTKNALILEVAGDQRLQFSARVVLIWLILHSEAHHVTASFFVHELGMDKTTALLALTRLVAAGWAQMDETLGRGWFSLTQATRDRIEVRS
jgi:DNA-binding transcriptional regulator PaaX